MSAYADSIARQERAKAYAAQAHDPIICPKCDGNLDTGFECLGCGYDAAPVTQPATSQEDDGTYPFWPERPGYAAGIIREPGTDPDDGTATTQEGEAIDYAEAARVMFEACRDRFMRAEQCYVAIDALAAAGFLAATPTPPTLSEDLLRQAASLVYRIEAAGAVIDEGANFERWKADARALAPELRAALARAQVTA